jgi:hypothetical protein
MHWVRVVYPGEQGEQCQAYFTVASILGQWAGGTKSLYALLRRQSG